MTQIRYKTVDNKTVELTEDAVYNIPFGDTIIVPSGFRTDGATVPFPFTAFYPRFRPDYMRAVVLHDFILTNMWNDDISNRKFADDMFYWQLIWSEINPIDVFILNSSVRLWTFFVHIKVLLKNRRF